ncbi:MAG TPA: Re/Si-specific NAD(P)(+) transhydrogenase subunit alpha, partial [Candidatus Krumholzibacteria bacterium]|nr:Re/Si-specific NAD(P)(+) transhydrogenase subunit alpha [Candidatus Krumholzibacteria bacterium]
ALGGVKEASASKGPDLNSRTRSTDCLGPPEGSDYLLGRKSLHFYSFNRDGIFMLTAFVPRETHPGETRVAATPDTVARLIKAGFAVSVQSQAGEGAYINDDAYRKAGATIVTDAPAGYGAADLVLKFHPPTSEEVEQMKQGSLLISFLWPTRNLDLVRSLKAKQMSCLAMDCMPRITRAQKMDALSSQANISGYKAVIMAANHLPKIFPMMTTPAGTIKPAHVVILGAGVAGLQAVATAKRLGAIVEVSDVRPAVKEQVESLGGKYIEVPPDENAKEVEDKDGYAKEQSAEFLARQRELVKARIEQADVVITTAAIPGKPAPKLVTEEMVQNMRVGSVVVDLAVETGGNCELSVPGETVVKHGVTLVGMKNVPGLIPVNSSEMYAKNILNLISDMMDREGNFRVDLEDAAVGGCTVLHEGKVVHAATAEALGEKGEQ